MQQEEQLARMIAEVCEEEKAREVLVLDVSQITIIADYFVIASGRNAIQVRSLAEEIEKKTKAAGLMPLRREGMQQGVWIILDYGAVLVHLFRQEEREYYALETLWGDAREVEFQPQSF